MPNPVADLKVAVGRNCHWAPDYAWLSLLKPQQGQVMSISGPLSFFVADSANQSLAASGVVTGNFGPNTLVAGSYAMPLANEVHFFETLGGLLQCKDASGKLQVLQMGFSCGNGPYIGANSSFAYPFTFPAAANIQCVGNAISPIPLVYPAIQGVAGAGPFFHFTMVNTDAVNARLYARNIYGVYRVIHNVDLTTGPAIAGAGVGG